MNNKGEPIPDTKLTKYLDVLCNKWFRKWKGIRVLSDDDWTNCIHELDRIMEQGDKYPICEQLGMALLNELERKDAVNRG